MNQESQRKTPDHESDPALNTEDGHEWVDEGGASHLGPATHTESGHPNPAPEETEETEEPDTE